VHTTVIGGGVSWLLSARRKHGGDFVHANDSSLCRRDQARGRSERAKYDLAAIRSLKRRTGSLADDALEVLDRIAKEYRSTVDGVAEAAGRLLREGGPGADDLKCRRAGDRRPKEESA
jgi:hypothetical protein